MNFKEKRNKRYLKIVRKTYEIFFDQDMNIYSGYATLYILMALIPLLMLIVSLLNLIMPSSIEEFVRIVMSFLPELPAIRTMLEDTIRNLSEQSSGWLASVSALTTLWSASNGVSAIQVSLDRVNGNKRNKLTSKPVAIVFTFFIVLLIPSMMFFHLLREPLLEAVSSLLLKLNLKQAADTFYSFMQYSRLATIIAGLIVILFSYTYLPRGRRSLKSQLPGAAFTMIICALFTLLFGFFMGSFWRKSSIYGSLAAIFLSAMWLKSIILIYFCGAALNKALLEEFKKPD